MAALCDLHSRSFISCDFIFFVLEVRCDIFFNLFLILSTTDKAILVQRSGGLGWVLIAGLSIDLWCTS